MGKGSGHYLWLDVAIHAPAPPVPRRCGAGPEHPRRGYRLWCVSTAMSLLEAAAGTPVGSPHLVTSRQSEHCQFCIQFLRKRRLTWGGNTYHEIKSGLGSLCIEFKVPFYQGSAAYSDTQMWACVSSFWRSWQVPCDIRQLVTDCWRCACASPACDPPCKQFARSRW